jgi:hypothetical protein
MKNSSSLIFILSLAAAYGKTAPVPVPKPVIYPFALPVYSAFTMPSPYCVGVEIPVSSFERQFATLYFSSGNGITVDTIPLDEYKGGTKTVLGSLDDKYLVLLQSKEIAILDRGTNTITDEYTTALPRADAVPGYFQGMITGGARLRVIAEMQPSMDDDGMLDPTLHSLVLDDVRSKKTIRKIVLHHPLSEIPPVFFNKNVIVYRNKRKDINEPWKALDTSLSPVAHPLCAILDKEFRQTFVWGIVMADQYKHAVIYAKDMGTNTPNVSFVSWQRNVVSSLVLTTGILENVKNLIMSPSGKWVFLTAETYVQNKRVQNHTLLHLDPSQASGYYPPRVLAEGTNEDRAAWISDPEGLVVFSKGQATVWDLSAFDGEKQVSKAKSNKSKAKHKKS